MEPDVMVAAAGECAESLVAELFEVLTGQTDRLDLMAMYGRARLLQDLLVMLGPDEDQPTVH